ncbi:hypothetical protein, partial [Enterococcus faecalis]|uniref:hypothetical protein n=1 Tax=Enterococcus faecalis TaxID=1351 RepID=UPI001E3ECB90
QIAQHLLNWLLVDHLCQDRLKFSLHTALNDSPFYRFVFKALKCVLIRFSFFVSIYIHLIVKPLYAEYIR